MKIKISKMFLFLIVFFDHMISILIQFLRFSENVIKNGVGILDIFIIMIILIKMMVRSILI